MEYSDGPIIKTECCLNCLHSVERKNGIACGDRGPLLRILMGLRMVERPNLEHCNKFERIPLVENHCKYCENFGYHLDSPACYNVGLMELLTWGPRVVAPTETCADFELAKIYQQRKWNGR